MPANKKHLIRSPWTRASKIIAAILGGLVVSLALHTVVALTWNADYVVLSIWFSFPLVWVAMIGIVYWIKNVWKAWGLILLLSLGGSSVIYFIKTSANL